MVDADQNYADQLLDSLAATQLRRGFPWLRFREPLEREFREAYRDQIRTRIKGYAWLSLAIAIAIAFMAMHRYLLGTSPAWLTPVRVFVWVPVTGVMLAVLHSASYQRL